MVQVRSSINQQMVFHENTRNVITGICHSLSGNNWQKVQGSFNSAYQGFLEAALEGER